MKFSLKSLRKPLLWIGTPLLIYALLGFLILPAIVKPQAEQILAETLKRRVTIGKIAFNPFLLKAEVRDFSLMENDAAFVRFAGLTIDLELASLWRRGPVVREVTLENPQIRVVRLSADRYNFSDLLDRPQNAPAQESGPLPRFSINNIRILGGDLIFDDRHLKSRQEISDLALAIPFVSTLPDMLDDFVEPGLSGKLNGRPFALTGKTKPFEDSRETSLSLKLDHLNLPDYVAYVPLTDGVHLPSGLLSADLNLVFRQGRGEQTVLVQGGIALEQLALKQGKETIFSLPAFRIDGLALDLTRQNIELARISATDGDVRVVRNKEGAINFTRLIASQPASQSAQAAPQPSATPAWKVRIGEFALDNFAVSFVDQTLPRAVPIALHQLALKVSGIDTTPATPAKLVFSAQAGKRGRMAVDGEFAPLPFAGKWSVDLQGLDAAYSQPYFTQWLNISLASGFVGAKGELALATQPALTGHYRGQFGITDFHAIDKISGQDFLKWRALEFKGIDTDLAPLKVSVDEIALSQFYSRFIVNQNGRLNLQDIVAQDGRKTSVTASSVASSPAKATAQEPLPPIRIGRIVLAGGNINYTDNLIQPNFSANLTEMAGMITGLASDEKARATLDLRGSVDRIAPVRVTGSLNPLAKNTFVDIKASVKGYELTAASTYAAKYAGYGIEKGKLSLDLAYFIDDRKLKARNQLLLDQFTLGEKSDSPDAVGLPVKFALAILTDRRGQINVNLPIEGTLDDPEFKVGRVIWKVLVNLLEKAVTAPFDALAALVGGDASLSWAEFAPGSAQLSSQDSIGKLAQALNERPALKLEIAGWVDPEADREGLKQAQLEANLRTRKLALLTARGESVDAGKLSITDPGERSRLLHDLYQQAGLPALVRNASAPANAGTEMEKLLLASIQIESDQLRTLALARAQSAKDALQVAGVPAERLFLLAPRLTPDPDALKSGLPTRVQFVLK
jgi:uncharacterized protein involved in outer membrane biogenesis